MVFHAPVRERGSRKSLYVYVFIELFALKLLIAVMARHAFFDSTYHVTTNIRFVGPLPLCAAYLCTKSQRYNIIVYNSRHPLSLPPQIQKLIQVRITQSSDNIIRIHSRLTPFLMIVNFQSGLSKICSLSAGAIADLWKLTL